MILKQTLCWSCKNACGGCSWSKSLKPVEGWVAEETRIVRHYRYKKVGTNGKAFRDKSYRVEACPLYQKEQRRRARG